MSGKVTKSWRGECDCGWSGPSRQKRLAAREDYEIHSMAEHGGWFLRGHREALPDSRHSEPKK